MRLIDADALPGLVNWCDIVKAPTIDAVPVIRCKDCRWYETDYSWNGKEYRFCEFGHDIFRKADDFCSRAERKEE